MEWYYFVAIGLVIVLLIFPLTKRTVVQTEFSSAKKKEATICYYLPASAIMIRSSVKVAVIYEDNKINSGHIIEQIFSFTPEIVADTNYLMALNHVSNAFGSDEIKFIVNTKGLLETAEVVAEDRTVEVISRLAEAPEQILGMKAFRADRTKESKPAESKREVVIKEFSAEFTSKVSDISKEPSTITWSLPIVSERDNSDELILLNAGFKLSTVDEIPPPLSLKQIFQKEVEEENNRSVVPGILTRPQKSLSLKIDPDWNPVNSSELHSVDLSVIDVNRIIIVPIRRVPFVKRVDKVAIKDGMVLSHEITNPSSFEGFVSIPVKIAKAIVSIPAQLIQFKIDTTQKSTGWEAAKLSYEKSMRDNQKFMMTSEADLNKIRLENEKARSDYEKSLHENEKTRLSDQAELKLLKEDLQTRLAEAETKRIEAENKLENLINKVEVLRNGK